MQAKALRSYRYVHIIFLWFAGLVLGMFLFYCFRHDFQDIIHHGSSPHISIFALLLSSFLPLLLSVVFLRQGVFCVCFIIVFLKAFLYGFSQMIYSGAISGLLQLSQTSSCFLLLLLLFSQIHRSKFISRKICWIFLFVDLSFIIFDYAVLCPMYS